MLRHLLIGMFLITGCANLEKRPESIRLSAVESSVSDLRAAIVASFPVGHRSVSSNGREILSKHFLVSGGGRFRAAGDALDRYYAQVVILGDRRPYDVVVTVAHEKRVLRGDTFTYVIDYYDTVLARDLGKRIEQELAKRREDRNIIDDFRVF